MEMIRTFRIVATENESFEVRDFKYAESYSVSGTTATVAYYDDEFTSLSYDTIDLTKYEVRACPNKTSRKGVYYKARPLPSIASMMPRITLTYRPLQRIKVNVSAPNITPPNIKYSIKYPARINVNVPVVTPATPTIIIAKEA